MCERRYTKIFYTKLKDKYSKRNGNRVGHIGRHKIKLDTERTVQCIICKKRKRDGEYTHN